ncbi:OmpH family outer membrane protein [Pseudooceanicola sp. C21-150M6]|uniref:OmpH family outer membrane protein n=1 Tax=Pseudooceanicola sp. C21-150M6 TaxID=3434355 RepID=UPI003D7F91CF
MRPRARPVATLKNGLRGAAMCLGLCASAGLTQEEGTAPAPAPDVTAQASQALSVVRSPILTLDSERLIRESAAGRRLEDDLTERSTVLAAENRRIEAELGEQERQLTEERPTLPAEEFRARATAFDERVQAFRTQQDAKFRALQEESAALRSRILEAADPVLAGIMQEAGAMMIVELGSVIASVQAIDVTQIAISRLDEAMQGQGTGAPFSEGGFETGVPAPEEPVTPTEPDLPPVRTVPGGSLPGIDTQIPQAEQGAD